MGVPRGDGQCEVLHRPDSTLATVELGTAGLLDPVRLRVNRRTYAVEGAERRVFTAEEWTGIAHPPCPVCGHLVHLKAGDGDGKDRWTITGWVCPEGCEPRRSGKGRTVARG